MSAPLIEGLLRKTLKELVLTAAPNEVGGIIIRGEYVHLLHNYAENPSDSFEFRVDELTKAISDYSPELLLSPSIASDICLWHSHPSGGVGPSRVDMQQKTPFAHHLVVALVDGDIVPTWY